MLNKQIKLNNLTTSLHFQYKIGIICVLGVIANAIAASELEGIKLDARKYCFPAVAVNGPIYHYQRQYASSKCIVKPPVLTQLGTS